MQFVLKPSLEHLALVKIGISLWNQNDVSSSISKLKYMFLNGSEWKKIEESVIDKVPQLSLPQLLKEKVFGVIKPIGIQIFEWMQYYRQYDVWADLECDLDLDLPSYLSAALCWTAYGTVDRKRTAEVFISDQNLIVSRRYRLACDYYLEDDFCRFMDRLPEEFEDYDWDKFPLLSFWLDKSGVYMSYSSYKDLFYSSVGDNNKVAAVYFLQKLTPQEREESLRELAEHIKDADVLCFLLPEMEEEEQKEVLKNSPNRILKCFLRWPWQNCFIGVANCMWDFISQDSYDKILGDIINNVRDGYKDYNYQKLFKEFWKKSPRALKHSLIKEIDKSYVLECLFDIKDKEIIRLMLKDMTITAKVKLIYSDKIHYYLRSSIRKNDWDFLEFFIQECLPSKNKMLKFKKKFEMHVMHTYFKEHFETKKQEWDQLFHMSDVSICKYDKISPEEGESTSSKRFQSLQ